MAKKKKDSTALIKIIFARERQKEFDYTIHFK
jgi:hypothetical protein